MNRLPDVVVAMLRQASGKPRAWEAARAYSMTPAVQKGFTMAAKKTPAKSAAKKTPARKSTSVRHSAIPKVEIAAVMPAAPEVTFDMIARRAYEIWQSTGGSEHDNWNAAERELRAA